MIQNILLLLGLLSILKPLILMIQAIFMHLKPMKDLKKTYGDNSWAVVTGGSDGIGFGFCEELAAQGFNICMISRSKSKIDLKIKELK